MHAERFTQASHVQHACQRSGRGGQQYLSARLPGLPLRHGQGA
jgi:hypothetical protein